MMIVWRKCCCVWFVGEEVLVRGLRGVDGVELGGVDR